MHEFGEVMVGGGMVWEEPGDGNGGAEVLLDSARGRW